MTAGQNQAPPPDADDNGPDIPPFRTFVIKRYVADAHPDSRVTELVTVFAHLLQHTGNGGLIFSNYVFSKQFGLEQKVRCGYSTWIDFNEIIDSDVVFH